MRLRLSPPPVYRWRCGAGCGEPSDPRPSPPRRTGVHRRVRPASDGRLIAGRRSADRGPGRALGARAGPDCRRPSPARSGRRAGPRSPVDRRGPGASGQRRATDPHRGALARPKRTSCPGPPSTPCSASTASSVSWTTRRSRTSTPTAATRCGSATPTAAGSRWSRSPALTTELEEMLRTAAARTGIGERRFDRGSPRLSLQLPDGSRLFALMAVAARPCLSIRRHRYLRITPDDLVTMGTARHRPPPLLAGRHAGEEVVHHLRRHRGRQDHPAAGGGRRHPTHGAAGHHRGLPRAGPRPLPRAAPRRRRVGGQGAEPGGRGRGQPGRSGPLGAAHVPRPGHRRRSQRRGSPRPAQRHEPRH